MSQNYHLSKSGYAQLLGIGIFFISTFLLLLYRLLKSWLDLSSQLLVLKIYVFILLPAIPLGLLLILWAILFKIEIESDRLRIRILFRQKELMLSEINGFESSPGRFVLLYPKNSAKAVKIPLSLQKKGEFLDWLDGNLKNLGVVEEFRKGWETAMADSHLGTDEAQRREILERAKTWAGLLALASFTVGFWAFLDPRPYGLAVGVLILLFPVAILSMRWFKGALRLNATPKEAYAPVDFGLVSVAFLALRALWDWHILDWRLFWIPFAITSISLFALLLVCSVDIRSKKNSIVLGFLICAVYGYGSSVCLNGMLDRSQPAIYESRMVDKRVSYEKHTSYYMTLEPWGPITRPGEFTVDREAYEHHEKGNKVIVYLYAGAFHIPYYFIR